MNKIDNRKLESIIGGSSISGTIINAVSGIVKIFFDVGKSVGSSFRRITERKMCPLN